MDAYHLASGVITLFAGCVGSTIENAVLPELVRIRERSGNAEGRCRSTAAFVSCFALALTAIFTAALVIAPGVLIKFFASGFDDERTLIGARMLWWLIPFASIMMYRPMLDIWANVRERYTLSSLVSIIFNFIAIPALLASMQFIDIYGVAFSMSAGHLIVFVIFLLAMRGVPLKWRARDVAWDSVKKIYSNSAYLMIILVASTIYTVVDRYFASGLPVGSVSAISYAASLTGIMMMLANTPMSYFLSMITKSTASGDASAASTVKGAIAMALSYFAPASAFIAASSVPIVSLIYGWGRFDAGSVSMTSLCLASYSVGFAFSAASGLIYRYALALGRLRTITVTTYALVGLNAVLDWIFVRKWGLLGLTLATSATQATGFIIYYTVILGSSLPRFLISAKIIPQTMMAGALAYCAHAASKYGTAASLASSALLLAAHLLAAEKIGLMSSVPSGWRPSQLWKFLVTSAKSYIKPYSKE
jgi:putative peptidoglycan lipid II flippase